MTKARKPHLDPRPATEPREVGAGTSPDGAPPGRILVIDDEEDVREVLQATLQADGHEVYTLPRAEQGLRFLEERPVDLVICDHRMPGLSGVEFFARLRERFPRIQRIFITGYAEVGVAIRAVNEGNIARFLTKPWREAELRGAVEHCLARLRLEEENRRLLALVQEQNAQYRRLNENLEREVEARTQRIRQVGDVAIFTLARLAESRDEMTGRHLERIQSYSRLLAEALAQLPHYAGYIDREYLEDLERSSPLHDIGKVGIPDRILLKPGRLTPSEFEVMKTHVLVGGDTLQRADRHLKEESFLTLGKEIAYSHHERWEGSGYLRGLKGEQIPLSGRIIALADVYDALTSKRVYKEAMDHAEAREWIVREAGRHFDPEVVEAFLKVERWFERLRRELGN
ncbi:MAG: HD domain-containing phosphohydrolase [Nitrospinota bacterium]